MGIYIVKITVPVPYPKEFVYTEKASGEAPAVSRSLKKIRKDVGKKKITEWGIRVNKV